MSNGYKFINKLSPLCLRNLSWFEGIVLNDRIEGILRASIRISNDYRTNFAKTTFLNEKGRIRTNEHTTA